MLFRRTTAAWLIGIGALCLARLAGADITIEQQIAIDGFGPAKIGALEGKNVTAISKDAARTEHQTQFKSKLLRAFAKGSTNNTVQIIRLDAQRIDEIDVANKQYTEVTFQEMRDNMAKSLQSIQEGKAQQQAPSGAPVDESQCVWSPAKSDIDQTGEHATIAGADASRATITVTTTCTDKAKGTSCEFVFELDQWLTPEVPGEAETREFWRNYAQKLNLGGEFAASMQGNARGVFDRYKNGWGEAMKQAGRLKGYPLKSVLSMQVGGPQCNSANGNNGGTAADSNAAPASNAAPPPTSPSGAVSNLAMNLFGKMHKQDDSKATADPPPAPGMVQLFRMSTETVAVRTDAVPSAMFEIPAGFRKIDKPVAAQ